MQFQDTILVVRSTLLAVRDTDGDGKKSDLTFNLLIGLISLLFVGVSVMAILMVLRRLKLQQRMRNEGILPQHNEVHKRTGNHRRLTIQTGDGRQSVLVFNNGHPMLANPHSPPHSPDNVPEIRVTFPDEQDDNGRSKSGRVVVVRVGDTSIGMEPLHHDDEQLPAYEKESSTQFYSIDMEKIGGLKEKDSR